VRSTASTASLAAADSAQIRAAADCYGQPWTRHTHAQQEPGRPRRTRSQRAHAAASGQGGPRETCHRAWLPADTTHVGPLPRRVGPTLWRRDTKQPHAGAHRGDNFSLSRMRHQARNRADKDFHTAMRSVHAASVPHTPLCIFGLIFIASHRFPEITEATASTLFAKIIQTRHWALERMKNSLCHGDSGPGPPTGPLCIWLGGVPRADNRVATPNDVRPLSEWARRMPLPVSAAVDIRERTSVSRASRARAAPVTGSCDTSRPLGVSSHTGSSVTRRISRRSKRTLVTHGL